MHIAIFIAVHLPSFEVVIHGNADSNKIAWSGIHLKHKNI